MKEFFGFGDYTRPVEGYLSWQHITFVSILMAVMVTLAIIFGRRYSGKDADKKNHVLMVSAFLIDGLELFKLVIFCVRANDPLDWIYSLPLFLCSIQLITIPLAAFAKGRVKDAALDFVFIFGILGAVLGTYLAGNNYSSYPVLSFDNVISGLTHSISGFASLYIVISGMASMKKKNIPICLAIITCVAGLAYPANLLTDCNYMFLMAGDGTPYDIVYNLVGGNPVLYPISVVLLFYIYITVFYLVYYKISDSYRSKRNSVTDYQTTVSTEI